MATKEAINRANRKYQAKTYKRYTINLKIKEDKALIEDIEKRERKGEYIRELLIKYMNKDA